MKTLDKSQQTDLFPTELESMSSQEDFHVRTSPLQEIRSELKAKEVGYGPSAPVFLGTLDQNTPSLKTSQTCLTAEMEIGLSEFCGTFPKSGMMQSGTVYELQTLARPTGGNESGSFVTKTTHQWPTPRAFNTMGCDLTRIKDKRRQTGSNLEEVVANEEVKAGRLFPTPAASEGGAIKNWSPIRPDGSKSQLSLKTYVRMFPTPLRADYKGGYRTESLIRKDGKSRAFDQLPNAVIDGKGTETVCGQLNPAWVEWLMGFPIFHTDLNA